MNDRVSRVGGRRSRRPDRQNPYYRPRNRPMQNEYHGRQPVDETRSQQTNEWSGRTLNEYALCSNSSQERDRSRYHRHSDRYWDAQSSPLKGSSQSTLRNSYLPNTHKDFQACRADSLQDVSRQRCAEMAYSNGPSIRSTRFRGQEHRIDQQNLDYDEQQSRSERTPSISTTRRWSDMVELEELSAEQHNSDFEAEHNGLCSEQMNEEFEDVRVQRSSSSSHVRQDSLMSNQSLVGSDSTTESKKMRMSATPRFTESELNTKDVQVIIARRKKQIEYGKVLDCYNQYIQLVPRHKRTKYHPRTPDIYRSYSRRGFDTLVRTWKKQLHAWEPAKSLGRSLKLGSTCESSSAAAATEEAIRTFKKEMKEDLDDSDYDSNFPPMPSSSAAVKTEGSSELPSVLSSLAAEDESGDSDNTPMSGVVVKTEMPDEFL